MANADNPLVSIVLTTYNSELTIDNVLNSIIMQEIPLNSIELIIVDGGSRDSTIERIRSFINKYGAMFWRVEFLVHDKNYGVSKARNDGIMLSKGKYILILDHDVIMRKDTIKVLLEYLEKLPSTVACVRPLQIHVGGDRIRRMFESIARNNLLKVGSIDTCTLCRACIFREVGLYDVTLGPPYTIYEDIELGARVLSKGYEIRMIGWHEVIHDARETPELNYELNSKARLRNYLGALGSLLNPRYRYALKRYLKSAPSIEKIRWRLYQASIILILISIISLFMKSFLPLLTTLSLLLALLIDITVRYWNPKLPHLTLIYSAITLTWRLARSIMLFIPGPKNVIKS